MAKITKDEVLKMAQLSHMYVSPDEIDALAHQLETVLTYAAKVQEIATNVEIHATKNINVFRNDEIIKTDADRILSRAPEVEERFFVVPAILETNK